ncbi:MAG: glycerate kinase [Burkholderiales bacterium]|jgi:hypothetical protein|nr:glycerate kinase [Burkholderiales bacterium]
MKFQKLLVPVAGVAILIVAYNGFGGAGLALAGGAMLMFLLLHFTRMMHVLRRASQQPLGFVASAVMLNARLKPGVNLLHVMAMTRSLGLQQSPEGAQPEVFRWEDASGSHVTCEFQDGRLVKWILWRPTVDGAAAPADDAAAP